MLCTAENAEKQLELYKIDLVGSPSQHIMLCCLLARVKRGAILLNIRTQNRTELVWRRESQIHIQASSFPIIGSMCLFCLIFLSSQIHIHYEQHNSTTQVVFIFFFYYAVSFIFRKNKTFFFVFRKKKIENLFIHLARIVWLFAWSLRVLNTVVVLAQLYTRHRSYRDLEFFFIRTFEVLFYFFLFFLKKRKRKRPNDFSFAKFFFSARVNLAQCRTLVSIKRTHIIYIFLYYLKEAQHLMDIMSRNSREKKDHL